MKGATACKECRERKKKCIQQKAGQACDQCHQRHVDCSHERTSISKSPLWSSLDVVKEPPARNIQLTALPDEVIEDLVECYIYYIHDKPHSIFHLPTLRAAVRQKSLNRGLLYAILSFGCRFYHDPEIRLLAPYFFDESKSFLHLQLENMCLENIQTCILLTNLSSALESTSEALYNGIAIRMAEVMGINTPDPSDSLILRETKRRVWWSLFMADRFCSAGRNLPRKMKDFDRAVDLPMSDDVFYHLEIGQETLPRHCGFGLWAYSITLAELFGPIQDIYRRIARQDLVEEELDKDVSAVAQQLQSWNDNLPSDVRMNHQNILAHKRKGLGGSFMSVHVGYHQYSTLLYFRYLEKDRTSPLSKTYAERCKYHANSISELLKLAREIPECEQVHAGVGRLAVISSSVLLHTLLFGQEHELPATRASLNSNFETLIELQQYWPFLRLTIKRLLTFQNICLQHPDPQKYKLDKWMVRFLLEHHLPLTESEDIGNPMMSPSKNIDLDVQFDQKENETFIERARIANDAITTFLH